MRLLLQLDNGGGKTHYCRETGDRLVTNDNGSIRRPHVGHGHYHIDYRTLEEVLHEFHYMEWMEV